MKSIGSWWLPWVLLGAFTSLWVARWPTFPLVLDPSYHLFVGQQVAEAGGPMTYEWWENAPVGRPHLYPPVLHLIIAALLKMGWSPLFVIRLISVALLPCALLSIFLVMRRLLGPSVALACLGVGMTPFSFHLQSATAMAASLGMIELLWLLLAVEHGRWLAGGLLAALLCYTHLGLPWIALAAIACYGTLRPAVWRSLIKASWGVILAVPWYAHLLRYGALFHVFPRLENAMVELSLMLYALAGVGIWRCWQLKQRFAWLPACWAGFTLLAPRHLYRWLSGEGMLPLILLAGVGADWCSHSLARALQVSRRALASVVVLALLVLSPTLARTASGWRWAWPDSAPWHLLGPAAATPKRMDASAYSAHIERVVNAVVMQSRPGEILWSNAPYAGGLVAALAHRPVASGMLSEVSPQRPIDPIGAAHVILWFKLDQMSAGETAGFPSELTRYPLTRVVEDDLAIIFRQAGVTHKARSPQAVLPFGLAITCLCGAIGLIVWDLGRSGQPASIPV